MVDDFGIGTRDVLLWQHYVLVNGEKAKMSYLDIPEEGERDEKEEEDPMSGNVMNGDQEEG